MSGCDSNCITCFGPNPTDCLACSLPHYIAAPNGTCYCDIANGYYYDSINNICTLKCTSGSINKYMDNTTITCVKDYMGCSYPYIYID